MQKIEKVEIQHTQQSIGWDEGAKNEDRMILESSRERTTAADPMVRCCED
jgi:hypothetical protein